MYSSHRAFLMASCLVCGSCFEGFAAEQFFETSIASTDFDDTTREDLTESAVFFDTMLKPPERLPAEVEQWLRGRVPSRLVYFRKLFPEAGQSNQTLADWLAPSCSKVLIAAHRGGYQNDKQDKAPENSLANIQNCHRYGYELFETDIQRTKDGHFVIVHDPTIDRETSGVGRVSDMTLLELQQLRKKYRDGSLSQYQVATLNEFLKQSNGLTVFKADLKPGVSQYFAEIIQLVTQQDALDRIIFRVPYREANVYGRFRKAGGSIPDNTLMFMVTSKKQVDDIKMRFESSTIEIKLNKEDPTNERTLDLIRYASGRGFVVETHAEGNEDDWRKLITAGVRIFHTRAPSRVKTFLGSQADR